MKKKTGMLGGKKTKKVKSLSRLKHDLDAVISKYVRLKYADKNGNVKCYTCPKIVHWKQAHCGHWISRSYLATRFDLDNLRPQEVGCNIFGGGKPLDFEENLIAEIGKEKVEALKKKRHTITKLTPADYEEQISYYKAQVKLLEALPT